MSRLASAAVTSHLTAQPGRAVVTARGHHFVVDSPAALGGPNEEINFLDMLLSALATCATFACEAAAREMGIALDAVGVTAAGDFDPRGLCGQGPDPRVQRFRVRLTFCGATAAQAAELAQACRTRCPVYTTLSRAAPIVIETDVGDACALP